MNKALIRDEAQSLFAKISFVKTSVADIAKACGLGKGTIYLYYKSKDEILRSIIDERLERIVADSDAFFRDSSVELQAKLERFFFDLVEEAFALKHLIFGDFENLKGSELRDVFIKYGRYDDWCVERLAGVIGACEPYSLRPAEEVRTDAGLLLELVVGRIALFLVAKDWNDKEGLQAIIKPLALRLFNALFLQDARPSATV
jgi:AcrR family transcriptional regulator